MTNDDGVESAGIRALAGVGVAAGFNAVEAAPAFIARAGLQGAFGEPPDVVLSGIIAGRVLRWLLDAPPGVALNLNVPDVPVDDVRGLVRAHLSSAGVVQATLTEVGKGYVKMSYVEGNGHLEPGSDAAFLDAGYATLTPILAPCEAGGVDTAAVVDVLEDINLRA